MTDKYIDLAEEFKNDSGYSITAALQALPVLRWLDEHPDQAPGRTITESEMARECGIYGDSYRTGFSAAGGRIVPDPEPDPEDVRRLGEALEKAAHTPALGWNSWAELARYAMEQGVKAPEAGGDDE